MLCTQYKMAKFKGNPNVKKSNKQYSKVQKRGESKKSRTKSLNKGATPAHLPKHLRKQQIKNRQLAFERKKSAFDDPSDAIDASDMIEDKDLDYLKQNAKKLPFFNTNLDFTQHVIGTKGKDDDIEDEETHKYEKVRRTFDDYKDSKKFRHLLPIKGNSGIIPVRVEVDELSENEENHSDDDEKVAKIEDDDDVTEMQTADIDILKLLSPKELLYRRRQMLSQLKVRIAKLSDAIIGNPQSNIPALKELILLLDNKDPLVFGTLQKLVMISAVEVFKDIIPGYRIRSLTETELEQKQKKDTKDLHAYEDSLLVNYKLYLKKLESSIEAFSKTKKMNIETTDSVDVKLAEIAIRCLCELLVTHPHFNFRSNIIVTLVPFMAVDNQEVSDICCKTVKTVYRQDKLGDVSVEIVKQTAKLLKTNSFTVPQKVLETFLSLKIKDFNPKDGEEVAKKRHDLKLSKREIKRKKKLAELETELRETAGEESRKQKFGFQTEIVNQVFATYFRILKKSPSSNLLSIVLEGLAKFSHVINVDFFDDLVAVLHSLIESGDLGYRQILHCVQTVMTILSGQGEALNIDPLRFYTHLYKNLFELHAGSSSKDIPVALACLDIMINKRCKKVSTQRVSAFTKRVCTLSLQQLHDGAIGLLVLARSFFLTHKHVDILLDTDTSQASGVYLPELEEPEYCNANSASLWELHLLRHHYHPAVRMLAQHLGLGAPILGDGQLPQEISRRSAIELYEKYDSNGEQFNPSPPETIPKKKTKFYGKDWTPVNNELRSLVNQILNDNEDDLKT